MSIIDIAITKYLKSDDESDDEKIKLLNFINYTITKKTETTSETFGLIFDLLLTLARDDDISKIIQDIFNNYIDIYPYDIKKINHDKLNMVTYVSTLLYFINNKKLLLEIVEYLLD